MRRSRSEKNPEAVRRATAPPIPAPDEAQPLAELQSSAGNQVVNHLVDRHIQTKLVVGTADDPVERQAERVADAVLQRLGHGADTEAGSTPETDAPVEVGAAGGEVPAATERAIAASPRDGFPLSPPVRRAMEDPGVARSCPALGADDVRRICYLHPMG
jgi:hypothetical protein